MIELADALHDYEHLQSELYAAGGRLSQALVKAQASKRVSPASTSQITAAFADAHSFVASSQSASARGHNLLSRLAGRLEIPIEAFGDGFKDPASW